MATSDDLNENTIKESSNKASNNSAEYLLKKGSLFDVTSKGLLEDVAEVVEGFHYVDENHLMERQSSKTILANQENGKLILIIKCFIKYKVYVLKC